MFLAEKERERQQSGRPITLLLVCGMLSYMVEFVGDRWGMPATSLVLGKNVVCGMAGCGSSWGK